MTYCPACSEAGVPTCSDGLGDPVHVAVVAAEVWDALVARRACEVLDETTGRIEVQLQSGPRATSGPVASTAGDGRGPCRTNEEFD